jgi:hypothetical protein
VENIDPFKGFATASISKQARSHQTSIQEAFKKATELYKDCLLLSLLTPVLAEAFVNLTILMLCKKEIRKN